MGAIVPRLLTIEGTSMAVENGVGRDTLCSGMAVVADGAVGAETLALTSAGFDFIVSALGRGLLEDVGVLPPLLTG